MQIKAACDPRSVDIRIRACCRITILIRFSRTRLIVLIGIAIVQRICIKIECTGICSSCFIIFRIPADKFVVVTNTIDRIDSLSCVHTERSVLTAHLKRCIRRRHVRIQEYTVLGLDPFCIDRNTFRHRGPGVFRGAGVINVPSREYESVVSRGVVIRTGFSIICNGRTIIDALYFFQLALLTRRVTFNRNSVAVNVNAILKENVILFRSKTNVEIIKVTYACVVTITALISQVRP